MDRPGYNSVIGVFYLMVMSYRIERRLFNNMKIKLVYFKYSWMKLKKKMNDS
jgi:hypothetical protein